MKLATTLAALLIAGSAQAATFTGEDFRPDEGYIDPLFIAEVDGQTANVSALNGLAYHDLFPALGGIGVDTPGGSVCGDNMCGPEALLFLFGGDVLAEFQFNGDHVPFTGTSIVQRIGFINDWTGYYVSTGPDSQGYVSSVTTSPIPLPASALLLIGGIAAIGAIKRR